MRAYKELGITPQCWVEKTGFSKDQFYKWHNPQKASGIRMRAVHTICERLDISIEWLASGTGPMRRSEALSLLSSFKGHLDKVSDSQEWLDEFVAVTIKRQQTNGEMLTKIREKLSEEHEEQNVLIEALNVRVGRLEKTLRDK